ncbi:aldo/keto reductase [Thermosediminibacter oceani]|uniref:Aldo/keto reductase n=1 Tax=Thermosediminibacter oceani (strain ATCC BAA-1034 / DSM 16646 / JW/IW-1228P) TaxID=555079 RepID=D9RXN4_THEOJ|nr:aldo/keto reductase [Thermosediminibacter oceani]ADL08108.1 aldo/keto reductase [Thermosediminibacter oceani DSM 16646]
MQYTNLGKTGIKVSRLCFGTLTLGPLQANFSAEKGADLICKAVDLGVNFLDTAEFYQNYPHICLAIKKSGRDLVVATKSYAYTYQGMRESVEKARKALDRDVIDIFMLHEQESRLTLKGHREALEYLIDAKEKGIIRATGVSTHTVEVVLAAAGMDEIDVIHPIVNYKGIGIKDGTVNDMIEAIKKAYENGKGIYGMKCLGGGNLVGVKKEAFKFILGLPYLHSVAVGMKSEHEIVANILTFEGKDVPEELERLISSEKRRLLIEDWCEGCGRCVEKCGFNALSLEEGRAVVNSERCTLCGYCGGVCPEFCIKIV